MDLVVALGFEVILGTPPALEGDHLHLVYRGNVTGQCHLDPLWTCGKTIARQSYDIILLDNCLR